MVLLCFVVVSSRSGFDRHTNFDVGEKHDLRSDVMSTQFKICLHISLSFISWGRLKGQSTSHVRGKTESEYSLARLQFMYGHKSEAKPA